jgi:hypothetical protein
MQRKFLNECFGDGRKDFVLGSPRLWQFNEDLTAVISEQIPLRAQITFEIRVEFEPRFSGFERAEPELETMRYLDRVPDGLSGG